MAESQLATVILKVLASEERARNAELRALEAEQRAAEAEQRAAAAELEVRQDSQTFDRIAAITYEIDFLLRRSPQPSNEVLEFLMGTVRRHIDFTNSIRWQ